MTDKPSGMEIMFRSLGLGPAIDAAKQLAESGAIQKIVEFADKLETLDIEGLNGLPGRLDAIERVLDLKSDPGSADGAMERLERFARGQGSSETDTGNKRSRRNGAANKPVDDGHS